MINEMVIKYINLCHDLNILSGVYSKSAVRKHNKLARDLLSFATEINSNQELANNIFGILIENDDINVRMKAAVHCLKFGYHIKKAEYILEQLICDNDKIRAFNAEMVLKVWRGEVPGKKL